MRLQDRAVGKHEKLTSREGSGEQSKNRVMYREEKNRVEKSKAEYSTLE